MKQVAQKVQGLGEVGNQHDASEGPKTCHNFISIGKIIKNTEYKRQAESV